MIRLETKIMCHLLVRILEKLSYFFEGIASCFARIQETRKMMGVRLEYCLGCGYRAFEKGASSS
jgi:hypothetical protein